MGIFRADMYRKRITDVTVEDLRLIGVRGLLLDIDNTLTRHNSQELSPEVKEWIAAMQAAGIALTVVSNGKRERVEPFEKTVGLPCISTAAKPLPFGFRKGIRRLGIPRKECAAIGDQLFTDLWGARLSGVRMIMLEPIELEHDRPFLMFKRRWEKRLMKRKGETP